MPSIHDALLTILGLESGWGNVMQDYVMMALLAHTTNRS